MNHYQLLEKNILLKIFCTLFLFHASWLQATICQSKESGISWDFSKHSKETAHLSPCYVINKAVCFFSCWFVVQLPLLFPRCKSLPLLLQF